MRKQPRIGVHAAAWQAPGLSPKSRAQQRQEAREALMAELKDEEIRHWRRVEIVLRSLGWMTIVGAVVLIVLLLFPPQPLIYWLNIFPLLLMGTALFLSARKAATSRLELARTCAP